MKVLGSRNEAKALLNIGRYYALDSSLGSHVYLDASKPHAILICGKRGYGKSYTLGILIEELAMLEEDIRKKIGIVVIDTLGMFWTSFFPNIKEKDIIRKWGYEPRGYNVSIFSSYESVKEYRKKGIDANPLLLKTSEIGVNHWLMLFNLKSTDSIGIAIARALNEMKEEYSIDDILEFMENDKKLSSNVKIAAENFFKMAKSWNIFDKKGVKIEEIVKGGRITILDLSPYMEELKILITSIIARKIFEERVRERKKYEESRIKGEEHKEKIPITWIAIDEAHVFIPIIPSLSKEILIKQCMRQGRYPGISLILATQRIASMDKEVLSHCDIIISHRLTSKQDIEALNEVKPVYMQEEMKEALKKVGREKGVALIIDDTSESVHIIKMRPRLSWHGGEEPSII